MGHFKNTLPYGTIGEEWDGPIPATYRLPRRLRRGPHHC